MASEARATCAACGNQASNKCDACKSDTNSRNYCGKACQAKDWPSHKKACKDAQNLYLKKALARTAEIAQQAWYVFRQNTWDTPIRKIIGGDDALVIYDDVMLNKTKYFLKFPDHLVTREQTKKAMLCAWCCHEPLAWMQILITAFIQVKTISYRSVLHLTKECPTGLNVEIEEIKVSLGTIS